MAVLARSPRRCVLVAPHDVVFAARGDVSLDLVPGTRVSLFPMAAVTGRSEGLAWPIEGLNFRPDGRIGTSNEATGPVRMRLDGSGMLVILPRIALGVVVAALR
jgi:thiamine pyrophosphokinase